MQCDNCVCEFIVIMICQYVASDVGWYFTKVLEDLLPLFFGRLMWSIFGEALSKQKTALEAAQARTWFDVVYTVYTGTGPQMTWGDVFKEKWWNLARDTGESIWPSSVNRGAPQHFTTSKHRGSSNAGAAWCMAGPGLPQLNIINVIAAHF